MDDQTKAELVEAVKTLIQDPEALDLFDAMNTSAPLIARYKWLRLIGDAHTLNVLAILKTKDPQAYEGVLGLIASKRAMKDLPPLLSPESEGFDKTSYMQEFMLQKRQRQRRAADIENMNRAPRDRLIGRARLDFMQRQSALWKEERDALIEKAKAAHGGKLKKDEMQLVLNSFWAKVDARLDDLEDKARYGGLRDALQHDPYSKKSPTD